MSNDLLTDYLEQSRAETIGQIQEAISCPSVSPERSGGRKYAEFLRDLYLMLGAREAEVVETGDDWPGVWGYFDAGARHTIASYAYFDTYGVDEATWDTPPYTGTLGERDGFPQVVSGRGATVKGSHIAWVTALSALAATRSLPVNVLVLSEGAEMVGSPNFQKICESASRHLSKVSAFLSPRISEGRNSKEMAVVLGYKNMVTFDLVCRGETWGRGPVAGSIYGNSKSIVDAPTHRVVQAASSLLGPDGNSIAVEGLRGAFASRKQLPADEAGLVESLRDHFADSEWGSVLPTAGGVERWAGDLAGDEVLTEYLYGPSVNISEIRSAGVGDQPQLTMLLPAYAKASFELRMVTDLSAGQIVDAVREHLQTKGFSDVTVEPYGLWDGCQVSPSDPIVLATVDTFEKHGITPVLWPIQPFGGPWAGVPHNLGVPSLSGCSIGYGANGGGSSNEYMVIESDGSVGSLVEAERFMCDLLLAYAGRLNGS